MAGADTIAALNVPVERRLASLIAAKEALAARQWGDRYLLVNVASAEWSLVENGTAVLSGAAIVGDPATPTPALDGSIDRLELHPAWRVPQRTADRALWPRQDADPNYFTAHGVHVTDDGLIQDAGWNPLGPVKFLFDNPAGIALHGVLAAKDFDSADRRTSLGCVAIDRADDLARRLLATNPDWSKDRIDAAMAGTKHDVVTLATPLPIHIVGDPVRIDPDGTVHFHDDPAAQPAESAVPSDDPAGPCGS